MEDNNEQNNPIEQNNSIEQLITLFDSVEYNIGEIQKWIEEPSKTPIIIGMISNSKATPKVLFY